MFAITQVFENICSQSDTPRKLQPHSVDIYFRENVPVLHTTMECSCFYTLVYYHSQPMRQPLIVFIVNSKFRVTFHTDIFTNSHHFIVVLAAFLDTAFELATGFVATSLKNDCNILVSIGSFRPCCFHTGVTYTIDSSLHHADETDLHSGLRETKSPCKDFRMN